MIVQEPVQAAIWHCLNHYAFSDAIFLAERLCAEVDSDETLFLLATCYYRSGKPGQAYSILRNRENNSPQCKFLMAQCCLDLNKLAEAESVLTGGDITHSYGLDELVAEFGDEACFALKIFARICSQTERGAKASEAYHKVLKLNPFLWNAFEELCNRGEVPDPTKTFQVSGFDNFTMCHGVNPVVNFVNNCDINANGPSVGTTSNSNSSTNSTDIMTGSVLCTPIQVSNSFGSLTSSVRTFSQDESPLATQLGVDSGMAIFSSSTRNKSMLIRNLFNSSSSPMTPSFGILPLEVSPAGGETLQMAYLSHVPATTLGETNDQKSLAKRVSSLRAQVGQLISRKETPLQQSKPVFSQSVNTSNSANIVMTPSPASTTAPLQAGQNVRRSSRLFGNSYSVKENNKSPNRNKFVTPKSPSRKTKSRISKTNCNKTNFNDLNERNRSEKSETITSETKIINVNASIHQNIMQQALSLQKHSAEGLMSLLRDLGTAYLHLSQFNCRKAIDCLTFLPSQQYNTGWVLSLMGKAYFELTDYQQAVKFFSDVREKEPYRCQLMELYSTALWHLQREVALSALAQDLVAQDRYSPAAWCATGNCFSLQKEHDSAIKFFQRAVQVDPTFVYAYTLLGHEYVTTEELDKAMNCFRSAVRIDTRHYNAWYGIGTIYSKQERYLLAEVHYRKALAINTHNAVLLCHIGVVQHAQQKTEKALQTLNTAIGNDPKNALCKFHRASIYFAASRHAEALKELEELKEIVPKESLVYYLTGKVHKKLGNTHLALMHFSWATDLDPKGANSQIKEAIDPTMSRSQAEEDVSSTNADYPSDGSSAPANESSEGAEFVNFHMADSDDSL